MRAATRESNDQYHGQGMAQRSMIFWMPRCQKPNNKWVDKHRSLPDVRCVIGTLTLAIQTNALIEEPLVRVPGGLSANRKLSGFHGGISPAKSAYRALDTTGQFILGKTEHPPFAEKREG